jgi:hypothetical protein
MPQALPFHILVNVMVLNINFFSLASSILLFLHNIPHAYKDKNTWSVKRQIHAMWSGQEDMSCIV